MPKFFSLSDINVCIPEPWSQKTEWQGTIEKVNDITIIKNPNVLNRRAFYMILKNLAVNM